MLAAIDADGADEVWCLGDVVGYGPCPNECSAIVRERAAVALCGNHDLAVVGSLDVADFTGDAAAAVSWTQRVLAPDHAEWLRSLAPKGARSGYDLFHGSPLDPVWDYVLSEDAAWLSLRATSGPVILVGHSHVALGLSLHESALDGGLAPEGTSVELAPKRWLLNPGSVGQPRDGDPRAAYLLIDVDAGRATFRRVPYPIETTQAEIRDRGLPQALAARLAHGV